MIEVDTSRCELCGTCSAVCPSQAIRILNMTVTIDRERCTGCQSCLIICPVKAIENRAVS